MLFLNQESYTFQFIFLSSNKCQMFKKEWNFSAQLTDSHLKSSQSSVTCYFPYTADHVNKAVTQVCTFCMPQCPMQIRFGETKFKLVGWEMGDCVTSYSAKCLNSESSNHQADHLVRTSCFIFMQNVLTYYAPFFNYA